MTKKPVKKPASHPQPSPAQIKAIERLLEARRHGEAIDRSRPLIERFPDHGGLRRLLIEALAGAEGESAAALAAFEWASARPRSLRAQETLLYYAIQRGYLLLADRTARLVHELGGETKGFPIPPAILDEMLRLPNGTQASQAEMVRLDIAKLYMEALRFETALEWLDGLELLPALNNRALVLYHLGRIEEALEAFIANWNQDADNLLALGWAARLRLYRGDEVGARGLCTPLAGATARRDDDALGQLGALLLLGEDQAAWEAFERARRADWFETSQGVSGLILRHFGACAASRLGRVDEARRLWREAVQTSAAMSLPADNLKQLDEQPEAQPFPMVFDISLGLPMGYMGRLREQAKARDPDPRIEQPTATNAYLDLLYRAGDGQARSLILFVLKDRVSAGDEEAADVLKAFARLPIGTTQERFGLLGFLREQGRLAEGEPLMLWDQGECREVKLISTEIYREPAESTLPEDLEDDYAEAVGCFNRGEYETAERIWLRILERVPEHPMALGNLAAVHLMRGNQEEGRALLRRAIASNPDYLFARCNLANLLIGGGELEEAQKLLAGLAERPRLHIQEVFALYGAMARLKQAQGDEQAVQGFIDYLERLVDDEDDERRLMQIKRAVQPDRFRMDFEQALSALLKRRPGKRGKRR